MGALHTTLPFLLALVAAVVLLEMWAVKLRVAYPILLVIAGLLISFVPSLPRVTVHPDLIFFIFLPPLLFEASWTISFKEMRKWWRIIGSFAFLVVFFTAMSVAVVANHVIPGFTLALGFLLGGIVSPPDAVSTGAITKFVNIPRTTSAILEGESLLNDASSLIIFRFALVAVGTGQFFWADASAMFLWMVLGGTGIGLLLAWLFIQAHKRLPTTTTSDIALTLIEPYAMYWVAEQLHCSGVLAVVAGGLYMSAQRLVFLNSAGRLSAYSVWQSLVFILNGIVFLLIGLALPDIVEGLRAKGIPLSSAIGYGLLVTAVLIVARIISSYVAMAATLIFRPSVAPRARSRRIQHLIPLFLGWTGMRGVVSLAAALAVPVYLDGGAAFPQRNLILFITFVVILVTLLVQGLTLPYLIRRWRLFDGFTDEAKESEVRQQVRQGLQDVAHAFLQARCEQDDAHRRGMDKIYMLLDNWTKSSDVEWLNPQTKALLQDVLDQQRAYLLSLNKDPKIDEEIVRQHLYQIDLDEERLRVV